MYKIPTKSTDCVHCHQYIDSVGVIYNNTDFCPDHPKGHDYTGSDVYNPSEWVNEVVGSHYQGPFAEGTYLCTGYDPRAGFWMKDVNTLYLRNVSERAIDRTYHKIRSY